MRERTVVGKPATPTVEEPEADRPAPGHPVLGLQRRAGNAATLAAMGAQGKLTVGAANDPAEREADRVARQVTEAIASGTTTTPAKATDKKGAVIGRIMQRRAAVGAEGGEVDESTERDIAAARSGGAPLAPDVRRSMEDSFGADFSGVRVHTGPAAADLNRQVQAKAFTIGNDVFFGGGGPDTSSREGTELLAHELTHVVQQGGADVGRTLHRKTDEDEAPEQEAEVPDEAELGLDEEEEGAETESTEEGDGPAPQVPMSGTIPSGSGPDGIDVLKDPGEEAADVRAARAHARDEAASGGTAIKINVGSTNIRTSNPKERRTLDKKDSLGATVGGVSFANPGGMAVSPFGSESFQVSYTGASWTQASPTDPINVNFNLDVRCPWGVNPGAAIDIASASSPHITADTVDQIVHDLTPVKIEKSWRAPRDVYWSQAICERHERFHSTDDETWARGAGKDRFANFVNSKSIAIKPKERGKPDVVSRRLVRVLDKAVADMKVANMEFYTGGAGSYLSYAGEERAFGDGKDAYVALADAVKARGDVLKGEQSENAKTTTSVKDKAKFFERVGKGDARRKTR